MPDKYIDDCPYCGGAGIEDLLVQHMPDGSTVQTHIEAFLPDELQAMLGAGAVICRNMVCEDCDGTGELDRSDDPEYVAMIDETWEGYEETETMNKNIQELSDDIYNVGIGTIQTIEALVDLLLANGVSETDIRQWFGLGEEENLDIRSARPEAVDAAFTRGRE